MQMYRQYKRTQKLMRSGKQYKDKFVLCFLLTFQIWELNIVTELKNSAGSFKTDLRKLERELES